ncbi:cupin domain-containing protein [Sulfitobacter sp. AS92]|uniref:cupin domain-containing protein n=1 Tax=Sulfitobacter sp. AS92 TaxID=3135783 RepID=UPI00317E78AF
MCNTAKHGTAIPTVLIDNDRTRVTRWSFSGHGDNTGWHRHEYDYLVVPVQDGVLDIRTADGAISQSELKVGVPYFRKRGVEHDVLNGNDGDFAFIEIEFLEDAAS